VLSVYGFLNTCFELSSTYMANYPLNHCRNILITRDGRAKLADVGLAHVLEIRTGGAADDAPVPGQGSGGFVGTLSWAAPEMLMGDDFTAKADIYR
jgi:serine/threonine protein kinase